MGSHDSVAQALHERTAFGHRTAGSSEEVDSGKVPRVARSPSWNADSLRALESLPGTTSAE